MIGNLKILSDDELKYLTDRYIFGTAIVDNMKYIVVKCKDYNRMVLHEITHKFTINSPIKRLTISKEAIDLWLNHFNNYSLIEVQNAINSLIVSYQDLTFDDILSQLARKTLKIKSK